MLAPILAVFWTLALAASIIVASAVMIRHWNEPRGQSAFIEMIYILPFAIFPIGANLIHLIAVHARPITVTLEIIVFAGMWVFLFKSNMDNPKWCKVKTLLFFVIQILILLGVRELVD